MTRAGRALAATLARRVGAAALGLLLGACGPRDVQQPAALVGRWEGHVAWRDATTPVALDIAPSGDSLAAMFSAPALGVDQLPIGTLSYDAPRVHFRVHDATGNWTFDGWLRRGLVVGAFSSTALGDVRNPSRLPQLSLQRRPAGRRASPWPAAAGVDSVPPPAQVPQRSLGIWLLTR